MSEDAERQRAGKDKENIEPPQYDFPNLPQYHLPATSRAFYGELRGPDSGISAIIPADKYASLRQAKYAEKRTLLFKRNRQYQAEAKETHS